MLFKKYYFNKDKAQEVFDLDNGLRMNWEDIEIVEAHVLEEFGSAIIFVDKYGYKYCDSNLFPLEETFYGLEQHTDVIAEMDLESYLRELRESAIENCQLREYFDYIKWFLKNNFGIELEEKYWISDIGSYMAGVEKDKAYHIVNLKNGKYIINNKKELIHVFCHVKGISV